MDEHPTDQQVAMQRVLAVLADESRLKIIGLLALEERTLAELAAALQQREPALTRHLGKLVELDLVRSESQGAATVYRLNLGAIHGLNRTLLARPAATTTGAEALDAGRRTVLANFLDGDRVKEVPANHTKRLVVLEWLADRFEPDRRYTEREVNELIARHHPDHAWLRRELVDNGFMRRGADGGAYRRAPREQGATGRP